MDIADEWKEAAAAIEDTESAPSRFWFWVGIVAVGAILLLGGNWLISHPRVRGMALGTTEVLFEADVDSALQQELELGKARLAHAFAVGQIPSSRIETGAGASIELAGIGSVHTERVESILGDLFSGWSRNTDGSGVWRVEMTPSVKESVVNRALGEVRADSWRRFGGSRNRRCWR